MANINALQSMNPYVLRNRLYLKEFMRKPIFLATGILYAVSAVLSALVSAVAIIPVQQMFTYMVNTGLIELDQDINLSVSISLPLAVVAGAVAFILMYKSAKNPNPASAPTVGLAIFWGLAIYNFVSIGAGALVFIALIILIALTLANPNGSMTPVWELIEEYIINIGATTSAGLTTHEMAQVFLIAMLVSFTVALIAFLGYGLFISVSYYKFASSMRNSCRTEFLSCKGARRYGIINIITAASCISSVVYMLIYGVLLYIPEASASLGEIGLTPDAFLPLIILTLIASAVNAVANIFQAKIGFGYRKHILAAGEGGTNLPLPVIVATDFGTPQAGQSENSVQATENVYAPAHEEKVIEVTPVEATISEKNSTEEKLTLNNANEEAKQIVEDVLDNLNKPQD